jgi:hypothetical protein
MNQQAHTVGTADTTAAPRRKYTLQLGWWTLDVIDQVVEASSPEEACRIALEDPNHDAQRTIYDCCTSTAVLELARGDFDNAVDAPKGAKLRVPDEHRCPVYDNRECLQRAAPDLLAAAKQAMEDIKKIHDRYFPGPGWGPASGMVCQLSEAIAKAERLQ